MRNNLATTTGFVVGIAIAYAIVNDWERSGRMIVVLVAALAFAALVTAIVISWMRVHQPAAPLPPAKPDPPPFARTGNVIFTMPPGTMPQGMVPYGYGLPTEQPYYHPGQLED